MKTTLLLACYLILEKENNATMFKVVMGYIYLTIFIGVFTWKLWATLGKTEDGPLLFTLVVLVILGIVLMVRKKLFENY